MTIFACLFIYIHLPWFFDSRLCLFSFFSKLCLTHNQDGSHSLQVKHCCVEWWSCYSSLMCVCMCGIKGYPQPQPLSYPPPASTSPNSVNANVPHQAIPMQKQPMYPQQNVNMNMGGYAPPPQQLQQQQLPPAMNMQYAQAQPAYQYPSAGTNSPQSVVVNSLCVFFHLSLSFCLSVSVLPACSPILCLSFFLSVWWTNCLFVVCLCVCLSVCLSVLV